MAGRPQDADALQTPVGPPELAKLEAIVKAVVLPQPGEAITSQLTGNTYTMGEKIGEGNFGLVYGCEDVWGNSLAAKVLKAAGAYEYEKVRASAESEFAKLILLRHPNITYVFDAFEYRDTFYIITERCYCPLTDLLNWSEFRGPGWLMPIARCLLQAVHYIHLNQFAHQDIHPANVFASFAKDEMRPKEPGAIQFKLGDLGVAKVFGELNPTNTRAVWMLPPEVFEPTEFGPLDHRIDIYHIGLLLLQVAHSRELQFSREEILAGRPREMATSLTPPFSFALEKALRRHVAYRTATAMELWRDLHSPQELALSAATTLPAQPEGPSEEEARTKDAAAHEKGQL
jgi:serine/threonine protein kinase